MSHLVSGVLGTIAASLALGVVHLEIASGHDLSLPGQHGDASLNPLQAPESLLIDINRSAKSDRSAASPSIEGLTIAYRPQGASDMSVLMRVPVVSDLTLSARKEPAPASTGARGSDNSKPRSPGKMVACEPMMSLLATGAKQFGSGRCLT